jgi:DNA-binding LacI/PurR family transcriptional regulator
LQPGLKHIAEECGVSAMAVSMALRDDSSISEKRRIEIKIVAERMGYRPNVSARSLRGGKTHSIGILWSLGGPHDSIGLIRDISLKLMDNDYVSYISDSLSDPKIINSCLKDYVARNVDGLIIQVHSRVEYDNLLTAEVTQYLKQIGNVVIANGTGIELPVSIQFDEVRRQRQVAVEEIIRYLAGKGRKKIALLFGALSPWREQAIVECMKANQLEYENCRLVDEFNDTISLSDSLLEKIYVDGALNYDAVLAYNDETAAQVISYLVKQGIKVPEAIAVVGFNDSSFSQYFMPPIASVERRSTELANIAVDLLLKRIKNKNSAVQQVDLPMRFVKRESAG